MEYEVMCYGWLEFEMVQREWMFMAMLVMAEMKAYEG